MSKGAKRILTPQCYVNGHPNNAHDGLLRGIQDPIARETVFVDWKLIPDSKLGEMSAKFDIIIGVTPEDPASDPMSGRRR